MTTLPYVSYLWAVPQPREELLERVVAFVADAGLTDLSLRRIAEGIGTSHRMLLYHFGSRAGLLAAIGSEVERQQRVAMADLAAGAETPSDVLVGVWDQVCVLTGMTHCLQGLRCTRSGQTQHFLLSYGVR